MNPELWSKPYDYTFEEREVKGRFLKFFEDLRQAKRITHDPFKNTTNIRCTFKQCKKRYPINGIFLQDLAERPIKDIFYHLAGVHEHFLQELTFFLHNQRCAFTWCKNGKELFLCEQCGYAPFPKPFGYVGWWEHSCTKSLTPTRPRWELDLGKKNTMTWNQKVWVLQINYVHSLWLDLMVNTSYDPKNSCWLVSDNLANSIEISCRVYFPNFNRTQKPTPRPGQANRAIGTLNIRKIQAANDIVRIISETGSFRAVQAKLHPDRFPDAEKPKATKIFQDLQEAWNKWEKA